MKKRILLLTVALSASVSFAFAGDDNTVKTAKDSNGNEYSYDINKDLDASSLIGGDTIFAKTASFDLSSDLFKLTLNSDKAMKISNCNIFYNVKLSKSASNPGTIAPFSEKKLSDSTQVNIVIQESEIVKKVKVGRKTTEYSIKEGDAYDRYVFACEKAKAIQANKIYKGEALRRGDFYEEITHDDVGGMGNGAEIASGLYYMIVQDQYVYPIINVDGIYSEGVAYSNSLVTYTPIGIEDGYTPYEVKPVDGYPKIGKVSGVVDNNAVNDIFANTKDYKYLNFDFTEVGIIGSVAIDITDNRIAYFNKGANATGQNIVVGSNCDSYVISDNGQEIYISKAFSAESSQYTRSFTHDTYGSIVLPFTVSSTSDIFVKQATLTSYVPSENKLTFTSMSAIAPNTPYMIKVLSTVDGERTLYGDVNGTVQATRDAQTDNFNGAQFIGTFEGLDENEVAKVYIVGAPGKIGRTKAPLKPGRCYLTREENSNAKIENATIEIIDEDGSIETIKGDEVATAIDGVVNGEVVSVQYISVNGQVSNEPFSGINIVKKTFADGSVETSKVTF